MIVDELVRCGVTDAVLCPGSRSAPLAFALHAADAAGRLRLHVRIDERTAGFLALGLALRSGRPVPVVTTSGTAVANLHPAVLEASHAGVPLLVLTADRPPQLIGTGANQTVVQPGIFGDAVRLALSAGPASDPERENGPWRAAVGRAVAAALGTPPGPVHVNLPFAEPLVPDGGAAPEGRPGGAPWTAVARPRVQAAPLPLDPAAPTLVIAGAGAPSAVRDWGLPVVAEPASGVWDAGLRAGPVAARRAPGRFAPGPGRGRRPPDPAPPGAAAARRPAGRRVRPRRPGGPQLARRRRDRPRRRGRAVDGARRRAGRRAGSTPTAPRPRRSTPPSTPRKRPAACGWPGRWSTRCPATRCSSSARRTRSATSRWRPSRAAT